MINLKTETTGKEILSIIKHSVAGGAIFTSTLGGPISVAVVSTLCGWLLSRERQVSIDEQKLIDDLKEIEFDCSSFTNNEMVFKIVEYFQKNSHCGIDWDSELSEEEVISWFEGEPKDVKIAFNKVIYELEELGYIEEKIGFFIPLQQLFLETDLLFHGWNPSEDAIVIVKELAVNEIKFESLENVIDKTGWCLHRVNSALLYLINEGYIKDKRSKQKHIMVGGWTIITTVEIETKAYTLI